MAKSGVGQDIKPHMLWVSCPDHVRLHSQCSNRLKIECEDEEGGEIRESEKSLAQGGKAINQEVGHGPLDYGSQSPSGCMVDGSAAVTPENIDRARGSDCSHTR